MSSSSGISHRLLSMVCLLAGCGDGLTRAFPADGNDGGGRPGSTNPSTLGEYGQPCGVLGNTQPMLPSLSPTGDVVALAVGPGHIQIHATGDGRAVGGFDAHVGRVSAMSFSPKENLLATGGIDGFVRLWRDGALLAQIKAFGRPVTRLGWSHDGLSLVVAAELGPVVLLGVQGNQLSERWSYGRRYQGQLIFSPDDTVVVVNDGVNHVLRAADGTEAAEIKIPESATIWRYLQSYPVQAQSTDGTVIAYDSTEGGHLTFARLSGTGEALTATTLWERGMPYPSSGIAFSGDSKRVALWGSYTTTDPVNVYDVANGNLVGTLAWTDSSALAIGFSGDDRFGLVLDSEGSGGAARLVDLTSGGQLRLATQPRVEDSLGDFVGLSADATVMVSRVTRIADLAATTVAVWNLSRLQRVGEVPWTNADPYGSRGWPDLSAKGDLLYGRQFNSIPGGDSTVRIESIVDPNGSTTMPDPNWTSAFALSKDGRTLAGAREVSETESQTEWRVWLYDLSRGAYTGEFSIGDRPVEKLRFSPDGTQLAVVRQQSWFSAGPQPTKGVSVWGAPDGRLLWEPSLSSFPTQDVAFSPDGSALALVGFGESESPGVDVYDARRGSRLRALDQAPGFRPSVRFSPDGRYLLAVSAYDGIQIWRTSDWQRYADMGLLFGSDAVFLPQDLGVLEVQTGVIWCAI